MVAPVGVATPEGRPEQMLSMGEVAARLRFGMTKTKELIYAGTIPSTKIGRQRRVRESDLDAYLRGLPISTPAGAA